MVGDVGVHDEVERSLGGPWYPPFKVYEVSTSNAALAAALDKYAATTTGPVEIDVSGAGALAASTRKLLERLAQRLQRYGRPVVISGLTPASDANRHPEAGAPGLRAEPPIPVPPNATTAAPLSSTTPGFPSP